MCHMMNRTVVLDRYYLDCRCMLLELAATLDRHHRAPSEPSGAAAADARLLLLQQAVQILADPSAHADRAERILQLMSEPVD
jgi:hypothetical protein